MANKEKVNLVEILKDCPKGTKLYSVLYGAVELISVAEEEITEYPIRVYAPNDDISAKFDKYGRFFSRGECLLFPSEENRDWSKFKAPKPEYEFKPFEKVLVRDLNDEPWKCAFFDFKIEGDFQYFIIGIDNSAYKYCIPYEGNEHLQGKTDKPKEE